MNRHGWGRVCQFKLTCDPLLITSCISSTVLAMLACIYVLTIALTHSIFLNVAMMLSILDQNWKIELSKFMSTKPTGTFQDKRVHYAHIIQVSMLSVISGINFHWIMKATYCLLAQLSQTCRLRTIQSLRYMQDMQECVPDILYSVSCWPHASFFLFTSIGISYNTRWGTVTTKCYDYCGS